MMADCLLLLLQTDILGGIICTFTNLIGGWFYVVVLAALEIGILIKYDNVLAPSLLGMFLSILMISQMPALGMWVHIVIFVVNLAGLLYGLFIREF
jgi:hypothetical protein